VTLDVGGEGDHIANTSAFMPEPGLSIPSKIVAVVGQRSQRTRRTFCARGWAIECHTLEAPDEIAASHTTQSNARYLGRLSETMSWNAVGVSWTCAHEAQNIHFQARLTQRRPKDRAKFRPHVDSKAPHTRKVPQVGRIPPRSMQ